MAQRTPLKIVSGQIQQFASGDTFSTVSPLVLTAAGQIEQLQAGDSIATAGTILYLETAGPAYTKTISPSMTYTKSVV